MRSTLAVLLPLLVSALGALLVWYSSPWGVGVSPDSAEYIAAARRLHGAADLFTLPSQWAPGYPLLLSLVYLFGDDWSLLTRLLQCLLLAANLLACSALLRHVLGRESLLPALGAAVLLLSFDLWQVTFHAWSEGPFLLCLLGSALALLRHLANGARSALILAIALAALAPLFRYAGVAWVGTAALTLLLLQSGSLIQRWRNACLFGIAALSPFLLWIIANQLVRQETTNREFVVHLVGTADFIALLQQFGSWLGLQRGWLLFGAETLMVVLVARQLWRMRPLPVWLRHLLVLAGVQLIVYTLFILFSKSFVDAYIPFDSRIFAPAWIFVLLALLGCILTLLQQQSARLVPALALVLAGVGNLATLAPVVATAHAQGIGYLSAYMASMSDVRDVPALANVIVYSNAPDYLRMQTGFELRDYPRKYNPTTQLANPAYADEVAAMQQEVLAGRALLVHYQGFESRSYFPSLQELKDRGYQSALQGRGVAVLGLAAAMQ